MPTVVTCPRCKVRLKLPDTMLARKFKCRECRLVLAVTDEGEAYDADAPPPVPPPPPPLDSPPPDKEPTPDPPKPRSKKVRRRDEDDDREVDPDDERPWDRPGRQRRDCEPHRGGMILTFGIIGVSLAVLSTPTVLCGACCPPLSFLFCVLALPLSVPAVWMGAVDLKQMSEGLKDERGRGTTLAGFICGIAGTILGLLTTLASLVWLAIFLYSMATSPAGVPGKPGVGPGFPPPPRTTRRF